MEKVIYKDEVLDYFDSLVFALFEKEYFSYPENARLYVDKIVDFIQSNISAFPHQQTPKILKHLGEKYIFYKTNSRTTWFIFFEKKYANILITGIINNHCEESKVS